MFTLKHASTLEKRDRFTELRASQASRCVVGRRGFALTELGFMIGIVSVLTAVLMFTEQWMKETSPRSRRDAHSNCCSPVYTVEIGPDSEQIYSGGLDRHVHIWSSRTGKRLFRLGKHDSDVKSIAVSPDGKDLVVGCCSGSVTYWSDVSGRLEAREVKGHTAGVQDAVFLPDGTHFLTAATDAHIILWNAKTLEKVRTFLGHEGEIRSLALRPGTDEFFSGGFDGTIRKWDITTGEELAKFAPHEGKIVEAVTVSPDGLQLVTTGRCAELKIWNAADLTLERVLQKGCDRLATAEFSPDGQRLFVGGWTDNIDVWDHSRSVREGVLEGHANLIRVLAFARNGSLFASGSWDGSIRVWDGTSRELMHVLYHE